MHAVLQGLPAKMLSQPPVAVLHPARAEQLLLAWLRMAPPAFTCSRCTCSGGRVTRHQVST